MDCKFYQVYLASKSLIPFQSLQSLNSQLSCSRRTFSRDETKLYFMGPFLKYKTICYFLNTGLFCRTVGRKDSSPVHTYRTDHKMASKTMTSKHLILHESSGMLQCQSVCSVCRDLISLVGEKEKKRPRVLIEKFWHPQGRDEFCFADMIQ